MSTVPSADEARYARLIRKAVRQDRIYGYAAKYGLADDPIARPAGPGVAHFVLVRFNLFVEELRRAAGLLDEERYLDWLERRVSFFRRFTLPSIRNQIDRNFRVLLFLDTQVDGPIESLLDEIANDARIVPIMLDCRGDPAPFAFEEAARLAIVAHAPADGEMVATTRLDSDDLLSVGIVHALQAYCAQIRPAYVARAPVTVNFPVGVQIASDGLRLLVYARNPFQTLLEPRARYDSTNKWDRKTVFQTSHDRCDKLFPVHDAMTLLPMWAQLVHGGNAMNRVASDLPRMAIDGAVEFAFGGLLRPAIGALVPPVPAERAAALRVS